MNQNCSCNRNMGQDDSRFVGVSGGPGGIGFTFGVGTPYYRPRPWYPRPYPWYPRPYRPRPYPYRPRPYPWYNRPWDGPGKDWDGHGRPRPWDR